MARCFQSDPLGRVRDGLIHLAERTVHHRQQVESVLATGEAAISHASMALALPSEPTQSCVDQLRTALRGQLQRTADAVSLTRQLCVAAQAQHVAVDRLMSDLDADQETDRLTAFRPKCHSVLVVDDYEDNRTLVALCLENAGFVVRTASNGLEALIAAYEMRPAVIVMDVTMPILDGVEATRLIKAIDEIRDTPVIAYTARPVVEGTPVRQLFAAVLQKPVSPEVVVATVQQCANL